MTIPGILEQAVIPIKFVVVHRTVSQKTPVGGNYVEVTKKERIRTDLTTNSVKERIFEQVVLSFEDVEILWHEKLVWIMQRENDNGKIWFKTPPKM